MSDMTTLILVLGGPGSGKSTVSSIVHANMNNSVHLKTGQIVRNVIAMETNFKSEEKEEVNKAMRHGDLVKDDIVCDLLDKEITSFISQKKTTLFILDGFPRTTSQLSSLKSKGHLKIKMVFILTAPHSIMEKRCKMRNLRTDRIDDRKGPVENRINDFLHHIDSIRSTLKSLNVKVVDIDTCDSMELMTKKIVESLKE